MEIANVSSSSSSSAYKKDDLMSDSVALGHAFLTPIDSERCASEYTSIDINSIGHSQQWSHQQSRLEKMNHQAHDAAKHNSDNFVVEDLVTYDKYPVIISNLLVTEAFNDHALPLIIKQRVTLTHHTRLYSILHSEATLLNLLEVAFFHPHVIESIQNSSSNGDEMLLELVDYIVRKLTWLNASNNDFDSTTITEETTREEDLVRMARDTKFKCAVISVSLLRYIAENITSVPLSIVSRLVNTHDVLCQLIPLIESPPWTVVRKKKNKVWKKYVDHEWIRVLPENLLQLTAVEGQVWIALYHLTCSNVCRERYVMNDFRKNTLCRARKYVNDILVDQLPFLSNVQRYMDELSIMPSGGGSGSSNNNNSLLLEQVPVFRNSLVSRDWNEFSNGFCQTLASEVSQDELQKEMDAMVEFYTAAADNNNATNHDNNIVELKNSKDGSVLASLSIDVESFKKLEDGYTRYNVPLVGSSTNASSTTSLNVKNDLHVFYQSKLIGTLERHEATTGWVQVGKKSVENSSPVVQFLISKNMDEYTIKKIYLSN